MAQDRSVSPRKNGRHPRSLVARGDVSHGIYAAMNGVQASRPHPASDRALGQSECPQLARRNDPVLLPGELSRCKIGRGDLVPHTDTKSPQALESPPERVDWADFAVAGTA
jgi:hypothetical protein